MNESKHSKDHSNMLINNNTCQKKIFNIIQYDNDRVKIKYEDYYFLDENKGLFLCKICKTFLGTKRKGNMIRHLEEKHFFSKTIGNYCGGKFLGIDESLPRCKNLMSQKHQKIMLILRNVTELKQMI